MKNWTLLLLLLLVGICVSPAAEAAVALQQEVAVTSTKVEQQQEKKFKSWIKKRLKKEVDFRNPVERWMWFGILALGAAILFTIIWYAGAFAAGTFSDIFFQWGFVLLYLFGFASLGIWLAKLLG